MLKELIEFFVTKLVDKPELVVVSEIEVQKKSIIEIRISAQDLAKVIGKEGRVFKALQSLVNVLEPNIKKDLVVDIIA